MRRILGFALFLVLSCTISKGQTPFKQQRAVAKLQSKVLVEASGIDQSYNHPGHLWSHNDSGDKPILHLVNVQGEIAGSVRLDGVRNRDWEDIVTVSAGDESFIFIADIGDNRAQYPSLQIHKIKEPKITSVQQLVIPEEEIETMAFTYSEGARDSESLAFDYMTNQLVLITKREAKCLVYSFPFKAGSINISSIGNIPQTNFTALDINEEGEILIKNYDDIFYFPAAKQSVVGRLIDWKPVRLNYESEPQGEAICWFGEGFYTLSERVAGAQKLYFFERK